DYSCQSYDSRLSAQLF
nr:immunoglobulin light chain junction region [Macaca mulatta]